MGTLDQLAVRIMGECRVQAMMAFRFLDRALWKLPFAPSEGAGMLATNARVLYVNPPEVIGAFRASPDAVTRAYLHSLLHCIFRHPFHTVRAELDLWQLACDVCVEAIALEMCGQRFRLAGDEELEGVIAALEDQGVALTPSAVYRALLVWRREPCTDGLLQQMADDSATGAELFARDSHRLWQLEQARREHEGQDESDDAGGGDGGGDGDGGASPDDGSSQSGGGSSDDAEHDDGAREDESGDGQEQTGEGEGDGAPDGGEESPTDADAPQQPPPGSGNAASPPAGDARDSAQEQHRATGGQQPYDQAPVDEAVPADASDEDEWADIAKQVEAELASLSMQHGTEAGRFAGNLTLANRSRIDYEHFLRRFAMRAEETKLNDDEFDYLFYTYGLARYGNMPLIEPLEYTETERIRDFVIAVDTSGSCSQGLVRIFLTRTYEILSHAAGTGERVNIHIVQCDAQVQQDTVIRSLRELREYGENLEVRGYGGTDFRPVFAHVDALVAERELRDLRGLIYFTDGYGTFPDRAPAYDVAFVFVEAQGHERRVPPWAMKVIMDEDAIEELEGAGRLVVR